MNQPPPSAACSKLTRRRIRRCTWRGRNGGFRQRVRRELQKTRRPRGDAAEPTLEPDGWLRHPPVSLRSVGRRSNTAQRKETKSCQPIPSDFTACSARRRRESIGRSSMPTPWPNGSPPTDLPARFTTWMPGSAAPTRCRSPISPPVTATPSVASIWSWCRPNAFATRTSLTIRTCQGKCR